MPRPQQNPAAGSSGEYYLKEELYDLIRRDSRVFDFLQEASLDGVWYWDITRPSEEWLSPRFKEVLGYEDHEVPNESAWWQARIHPDDLEVVLENYRRHIEDPSHPYDQVVRYKHKNGSVVWVRCRGVAVRDANGRPLRLLGAHTDVTALKRAEQALSDAMQSLEDFAVSAAHDLKTPLAVIIGFAETIARGAGDRLDEDQRHMLERISASASHAGGMIDDLLQYARFAQHSDDHEPVALDEIVDWVKDVLATSLEEQGATLRHGPLPTVAGNPAALRQLFLNLVSNSIKYRHRDRDPVIDITHEDEPRHGRAAIAVADNGTGIAPSARDDVFRLGWRQQRHRTADGSGIGLAVCRVIAGNHGGTIDAHEGPDGVGTTIRVTLPLAGAGEPAERKHAVDIR